MFVRCQMYTFFLVPIVDYDSVPDERQTLSTTKTTTTITTPRSPSPTTTGQTGPITKSVLIIPSEPLAHMSEESIIAEIFAKLPGPRSRIIPRSRITSRRNYVRYIVKSPQIYYPKFVIFREQF